MVEERMIEVRTRSGTELVVVAGAIAGMVIVA